MRLRCLGRCTSAWRTRGMRLPRHCEGASWHSLRSPLRATKQLWCTVEGGMEKTRSAGPCGRSGEFRLTVKTPVYCGKGSTESRAQARVSDLSSSEGGKDCSAYDEQHASAKRDERDDGRDPVNMRVACEGKDESVRSIAESALALVPSVGTLHTHKPTGVRKDPTMHIGNLASGGACPPFLAAARRYTLDQYGMVI